MHPNITKGYHQRRAQRYPARQALLLARRHGLMEIGPAKVDTCAAIAMVEVALALRKGLVPAGRAQAAWRSHYRSTREAWRAMNMALAQLV